MSALQSTHYLYFTTLVQVCLVAIPPQTRLCLPEAGLYFDPGAPGEKQTLFLALYSILYYDKISFIMALKPLVFLKEVRREMGKVAWLDRQQAIRLTLIVVGVSAVMALLIGGLDFAFTKIMEVLLRTK